MKPSDASGADGVSRRRFLERLGLTAAVGGAGGSLGLPHFSWADEGDSGPIDCGPHQPIGGPLENMAKHSENFAATA